MGFAASLMGCLKAPGVLRSLQEAPQQAWIANIMGGRAACHLGARPRPCVKENLTEQL